MGKEVSKEVSKQVSKEEAIKVLQEEQLKAEKAFDKEYGELCKKHGMRIDAITTLRLSPLPPQ